MSLSMQFVLLGDNILDIFCVWQICLEKDDNTRVGRHMGDVILWYLEVIIMILDQE